MYGGPKGYRILWTSRVNPAFITKPLPLGHSLQFFIFSIAIQNQTKINSSYFDTMMLKDLIVSLCFLFAFCFFFWNTVPLLGWGVSLSYFVFNLKRYKYFNFKKKCKLWVCLIFCVSGERIKHPCMLQWCQPKFTDRAGIHNVRRRNDTRLFGLNLTASHILFGPRKKNLGMRQLFVYDNE